MQETTRSHDPQWYGDNMSVRELKTFYPEGCLVLEQFRECPSILHLIKSCHEGGHTEVRCITTNNEKRVYYIPKQQVGVLRCGRDKTIGNRYVIIQVSETHDGEPDFWLVTCSIGGHGYLISLDSFNDDEENTVSSTHAPLRTNTYAQA